MTRRLAARRTLAAVAVAPLLLAGLAACSDDEPTAADETSDSASPSASPATAGPIDPATFVDDVIGGLVDASTAHLSMSLKGGPAEVTMTGDVDYSSNPPEMSMSMKNAALGDGSIEVRLVDGVMYMQMPQLGKGRWIKVDLAGSDSPLGDDLLKQMNPETQLKALKDSVTKVEYVGEEDVDGDNLKHYTMTVRSEAFRDLQDQLGAAGSGAADKLPSVLTYDLWTDDDGMLRQTEIQLGDLGSVTMTMSDWGEPVDIQAPPAGDVVEMPSGMMPSGTATS
jgi:LppX_LprAFG lipoprotein